MFPQSYQINLNAIISITIECVCVCGCKEESEWEKKKIQIASISYTQNLYWQQQQITELIAFESKARTPHNTAVFCVERGVIKEIRKSKGRLREGGGGDGKQCEYFILFSLPFLCLIPHSLSLSLSPIEMPSKKWVFHYQQIFATTKLFCVV